MQTTKEKPKRTRKRTTTSKRNASADKSCCKKPAQVESFFAAALTVRGRFMLSWMMLKAAMRILIKGRAMV
jgi:hypothetical protein